VHGKDIFTVRSKKHARQRNFARQLLKVVHGNETLHGKEMSTAKTKHAARQRNIARKRLWALSWRNLCRAGS
jgi:hypothetical protein